MDKFLEAGAGSCILRDSRIAAAVCEEFSALAEWEVAVPHYTIMPNHWHAILVPGTGSVRSLNAIMKRIKGRTAKAIRSLVGGSGPVWQAEWFDRWIRSEGEWTKTVRYIQHNPIAAGLVTNAARHPWTR